MRKLRLFSIAALALAMAACSSEENTLETQSPAANGKLRFTATIATPGNGSGTRTEYSEQTDGTINVAWKENDEIAAVVKNSEGKYVKDVLTVSKVNTDGSATISDDYITKPKDDALTVNLIYPADIVTVADDGSDYSISFDKMSNGTLDGTLESIANNIDYRRADNCALTVSGEQATLTSAAKLESELSIWKLTLQDKDGNPLSASKVTIISSGGVAVASATLATAGSTAYLPVPAVTGDICISATTTADNDYFYMKEGVALAAKKYYQSTVQMTKARAVTTFSELQTALSAGKNVILINDIDCTAEININSNVALTIDGNGKKLSTTSAIRAFKVGSSATVAFKDLTLTGFVNEGGPAINNSGTIVLDGCTISNCHVNNTNGGGAIENKGKLYAINTTFSGNYSGEIGGAINNYTGSLYMSDCTFTNNYTTQSNAFYGGAIGINMGSEVRLINCSFSENKYGTNTGTNDIGIYNNPTNYTIAGCTGATIASRNGAITPNTTGTASLDYSDLSNISFTYTAEGGGLAGKFSVDNGKQVQFSQGNLQYQASTKTWRFAENQYDYVGDAVGNTTSTGRDTQSDWIDLFGWGTAGHSFASGYGTLYQPWEDNTDATKYGPSGTNNGLYGDYAQGDWGTNIGAGWRTLTSAEWTYLFQERTDAAKKFGYATVAGKNGIIIVPDEFTDPMKNGGSNAFVGSTTTGFDANVYTEANWTAMEAAGCVFLPAAGLRNGTMVGCVGTDGRYWSSSPHGSNAGNAYNVFFLSNSLNPANERERNRGLSVRLVRPVE